MIRPDLESIPAYVPGTSDPEALKLSSNESHVPPIPAAADAMARAAANSNRYPDMSVVALKRALADHLGVTSHQVAVGCGSSALCQQLVQATSTSANNVIYPWRSFEAYPIFCSIVGAQQRSAPLLDSGKLDLEGMASLIDDSTSLIFLCTPNNPSGAVISTDEFRQFMSQVPDHVTVALDEAYFEYVRDPEAVNATEEIRNYDNVVGLRTFSKAYGLAGARVGYAFGPAEIIEALDKVGVPFQVSAVAQAGALASLRRRDEVLDRCEETVAVRDEVADHVGAAHSQANFVWLPAGHTFDGLTIDPYDMASRLAVHGVLTRAFPEGLRVTVTNQEEADEFLSAWDASVAEAKASADAAS